ncbi:hypothetical protein [Ideonella sp.]|uniref:hypothetical protein n=1 Tax=Ideonella sp. TaxID=1929293 RepID=UPI0037BF16DC
MTETVLYPTTLARQALAMRFGLPYDNAMQDWEWEAANADDFDQYLAAYTLAMPSDQRFSLMEMLMQSVEDSPDESVFNNRWARIRSLLKNHSALHAQTIAYWACSDEVDVEQAFRVSRPMRELLRLNTFGGNPQ